MPVTEAASWRNPNVWAIGLAGFGLGYLIQFSVNTTLHILDTVFFTTNWNVLPINSLILLSFVVMMALVGVFGSKKIDGVPIYFIALLGSLWLIIGIVGLVPWLVPGPIEIFSYLSITELFGENAVTAYATLSLYAIAGEIAFLSFALLNVLIACDAPQNRLPLILTCYGAGFLGAGISHFEHVLGLYDPDIDLWAQAAVVPSLLVSLKILHQHRHQFAVKSPASASIQSIMTTLKSSPNLWKVLLVVSLVQLSFSTTGWFDVGESTFTYVATSLFVIGVALVSIGVIHNRLTSRPTEFLLRSVQLSFALILFSSATLRVDFPHMSSWFGFLGTNGLYIASLGILVWYLNTVDECAHHGQTPDYPKFILILLIAQAIPVPIISAVFSQMLIGVTAANVYSVFGLLTTSALLVTVLAWLPGNTRNNDSGRRPSQQ